MDKRINGLVEAIAKDAFCGIGNPEPLKHALACYWSRRVTHRRAGKAGIAREGRGWINRMWVPPFIGTGFSSVTGNADFSVTRLSLTCM
jgi:hypothetical protein